MNALVAAMDGKPGDLLLFAADKTKIVWTVLGALRCHLAELMGLVDKNVYRFVWITEFPLLEWSDEENRFTAMHHPFTMPMEEDLQYIDSDPGRVRAKAYDIVLKYINDEEEIFHFNYKSKKSAAKNIKRLKKKMSLLDVRNKNILTYLDLNDLISVEKDN